MEPALKFRLAVPLTVFFLFFALSNLFLFAFAAAQDKDAEKNAASPSAHEKKDAKKDQKKDEKKKDEKKKDEKKKDEKKDEPKEEKKGGMTSDTFSGLKFRLIGPAAAS